MKIFASHNHNDNVRHNSSAGGVFSILSEKIIAEGGVVYGVAFNYVGK